MPERHLLTGLGPTSEGDQTLEINDADYEGSDGAVDGILRFMALDAWRLETPVFLAELVKRMSNSLGVSYAFCGSLMPADPTRFRTTALFCRGEIVENITYSLTGTPCNEIIGKSEACFAENVRALFPDDVELQDMGAESYAGVPLWGVGGTPLGLLGVIDDEAMDDPEAVLRLLRLVAVRIGPELERVRLFQSLSEGEKRFRDFAEVSSDWFWETDSALRFSWFSSRFSEVIGSPSEPFIGKTREDIGAPGADPVAYEGLITAMNERRPFRNFQHHRIRLDGRKVYLEVSGGPAYDDDGAFTGYRGSGREITKQKENELALMHSHDEANRANRAKSEFLASMSHELRTPLNAIQGMSEALLSIPSLRESPEKLQEYLQNILSSSQHLTTLIQDVLDLSRIEAGKAEVNLELFDPLPKVEEAIAYLDPLCTQAGSRIKVAQMPSMACGVFADQRLFLQVMLNLIGNAVKHGGQDITVSMAAQQQNGSDWLVVSIADDGPGFPEAVRKNIGQPFVAQSDSLVTDGSNSVGLGLSIVVRLMTLNDGKLELGTPPEGALVETYWRVSD